MNFGFALCIRPLFSDKPVCDRGVPPCSALLLPIEISLTFLFTLAPIFPVHIFPVETNANYFVLGEMQLPRAVHLSCTEGKSFWIFSLRSLLLYHIFPLCQECFEKNFNISENYHNHMVNFHNFIGRRHCQLFGLRRAYLRSCWSFDLRAASTERKRADLPIGRSAHAMGAYQCRVSKRISKEALAAERAFSPRVCKRRG